MPHTPCLRSVPENHTEAPRRLRGLFEREPPLLEVEPGGSHEFACPDCARLSRTVWGFVHQDGAALAAARPLASNAAVVGRALARAEVIGTDFAEVAFAVIDAVMLQDARVTIAAGAGNA